MILRTGRIVNGTIGSYRNAELFEDGSAPSVDHLRFDRVVKGAACSTRSEVIPRTIAEEAARALQSA